MFMLNTNLRMSQISEQNQRWKRYTREFPPKLKRSSKLKQEDREQKIGEEREHTVKLKLGKKENMKLELEERGFEF